ncbi:hypothetical protein [Alcanivorax sp.]|uniref:hypothetical protein n=1 Tax=Alcanivorax sp. TaxID=1872427 RepID=UPI000C0D261C|nr:hypothetical protein [Alcanivorax sp.]PHR66987.1 MAG: hypothetical protein COA55_08480 [Alcanivorax sp.]
MPARPETISFQRFRGRIHDLKQHVQTVDIALVNAYKAMKAEPDRNKKIAEALGYSSRKYTELNHPIRVNPRILSHSKSCTHQYTIIILHTHFSEYVKGLLSEIYHHDPLRVVGSHGGNIPYKKIVELGDIEAINREMIESVFRKLENQRSTQKLLDEILSKGNASVDEAVKKTAMAHLEMRHLFIHASGIADGEFVSKYGDIVPAISGEKLPLGYPLVESAIDSVRELCKQVDASMLSGGYVVSRNGT